MLDTISSSLTTQTKTEDSGANSVAELESTELSYDDVDPETVKLMEKLQDDCNRKVAQLEANQKQLKTMKTNH